MNREAIKLFREQLRTIQRKLGWSQKNDLQCCGVTMAQCHALVEIGDRDNISIVELAGLLGVDTSTLSRTIDNMFKAGLVDRILNAADRRYVALRLTDRGKAVFHTLEDSFDSYIGRIFAYMPEEKHGQVMESLVLVAEAIGRCNADYPCCSGPKGERKGGEEDGA
jgi:DNA-binding MarR family transcriptional regulator